MEFSQAGECELQAKTAGFFMEEIISFQRGGGSLEKSERMNESFPKRVVDVRVLFF